jgi:squalene-associated FAD-dependent desaturase
MNGRNGSGRRAVVVGGGLAGTSAAVALADGGWQVALLESRARLGGAVYSFSRDGMSVDTGQHVLLRCYSEYRSLLRRIGAADLVPVQDRMDIPVLRPGAPALRLRRARRGPAPLHLLPALLRYSALGMADRLHAARAMSALRTVDPDDPATDDQTFGAWLRQRGQGDRARAVLWGLVAVAALNIDLDQASLALAAQVFQTGLLADVRAGDLAMPAVPLSRIHHDAALGFLERSGVSCHTRERVSAVDVDGDGFVVRTLSGETYADAVVVAVPHRAAAQLLPPAARPHGDRWERLGSSPILNVHLRYDRKVTELRFGAVIDSPIPWFFDRTVAAGCAGQYLVVSVSAADAEVNSPSEQLLSRYQEAMGELFPAVRTARLEDGFVTREPHATFRQRAGSAGLRPPAPTGVPGLVLAGAWTDTGWPDTLEGAVRSGLVAARALGVPDRTPTMSGRTR